MTNSHVVEHKNAEIDLYRDLKIVESTTLYRDIGLFWLHYPIWVIFWLHYPLRGPHVNGPIQWTRGSVELSPSPPRAPAQKCDKIMDTWQKQKQEYVITMNLQSLTEWRTAALGRRAPLPPSATLENRYGPGVCSEAGQGEHTHKMDRQRTTWHCFP